VNRIRHVFKVATARSTGARNELTWCDVIIGATALERGSPLITGDRALYNAVTKLRGEARWFQPGG
jgi:hypothetical protein